MQDFVFDIKTKLYFGENQIEHVGSILRQYGQKVLFVYGQGSIKKNGIYDRVMSIARKAGVELIEFGGVEANPTVETARKGIALAKAEKVDAILAVGGGSAVDCGKAIGVGATYAGDVWDFFSYQKEVEDSLPVVGVVTLAASGTEMSPYSVLTNTQTKEKNGIGSPYTRLDEAILDPTYTFTVNAFHTACGVADAMSHVMENYFTDNQAYLQNRLHEGVLKTLIHYGPKALQYPDDYEARAQIFWASTMAINGILNYGQQPAWHECHTMGQQLSAHFDTTHGLTLALIHPQWYAHCLAKGKIERFVTFGRNVWGLEGSDAFVAEESVKALHRFFFETLALPASLRQAHKDLQVSDWKALAQQITQGSQPASWYVPTTAEDIEKMLIAIY